MGRYLRVYGILKSFNGRKSINAYALKRIDDHNEVRQPGRHRQQGPARPAQGPAVAGVFGRLCGGEAVRGTGRRTGTPSAAKR